LWASFSSLSSGPSSASLSSSLALSTSLGKRAREAYYHIYHSCTLQHHTSNADN
jgi:hypothetical protein